MPLFEFDGWRTRKLGEGGLLAWANDEAIKLIGQMRDALQRFPLWGAVPWGENESDIPLMTRVDGDLEPQWGAPRARVLHLNSDELVGGLLDYRLASRIHLRLVGNTALTVTLPTLTAADLPDVTGSSAHCTLRITNAGGFNVTSWPSNVKFRGGTTPSLTSMTAEQRWYFSLYADGTDDVIDCINSGPFG